MTGTLATGSPTRVSIYTNPTCTGTPAATGTPSTFTGSGITIDVADDSSTSISAAASNTGGNSGCSNSITYVEATPPNTTITSAPPVYTKNTSVTFGFSSSEANSTFACRFDSAATFTPCTSPSPTPASPRAPTRSGSGRPTRRKHRSHAGHEQCHRRHDAAANDDHRASAQGGDHERAPSDGEVRLHLIAARLGLRLQARWKRVGPVQVAKALPGQAGNAHLQDPGHRSVAGNIDPTAAKWRWKVKRG